MRCFYVILIGLVACGPSTQSPSQKQPSQVHFLGKNIDLAPYMQGYPYRPVLPIWETKTLLYDHKGTSTLLHRAQLEFDNPQVMEAGTQVSAIDWDTRSRWDMVSHKEGLYFLGDEKNDEVINLYRMEIQTGLSVPLTQESYTYGFSFSPDDKRIAYLPRKGDGPFLTCLKTMGLDGTEIKDHICDTPGATFTWDEPSWSPEGQRIVLRVNVNGQRDRGNLALIDLANPQPLILTNPTLNRTSANALATWLDDTHFVYQSDESGFDAVGIYALETHTTRWVFETKSSITHAEVLEIDNTKRLLITEHHATQDTLHLVDPKTGDVLQSDRLKGVVEHLGTIENGDGLIQIDSTESPFQVHHLTVTPTEFSLDPWLALPNAIQTQIAQCDVQYVQFPTFDNDPETGQIRQLSGYLYTPREVLNAKDRWVRIKSFYGGENSFSIENQIYCEAGVATFSPAVRGSWGFGTDFYRLNDGDLGGDEIADLFAAGKWLVKRGYSADKIGVYGRSHGGYATMRALTFPAGTNGHQEVFPFAFGMADAGFSNIIDFYEQCNIPDWVLMEAGDPRTEKKKLLDRSPISHVDKLRAPLFLSHGENDNRVPVSGSKRMYDACINAKKDCTFVAFPGQGHSIHGLANQQRLYQARFSFLEQVANTAATQE